MAHVRTFEVTATHGTGVATKAARANSYRRSGAWARFETLSAASCSWSHRPTSPARSSISTAARSQVTDVGGQTTIEPPVARTDLAAARKVSEISPTVTP